MKIYKIYHKDDIENCYVGSTKQHIEVRKYQHFADRNKKHTTTISNHMKTNPYEDYIVELLEECDDDIGEEREYHWINICGKMNKINGRSKKEGYDAEYSKKYRETHLRDPEKHNNQMKQYYQKYRERILEKNKEIVVCECGKSITKPHLKRHMNSKSHLTSS
jgi:hypothetical protein